MEYDSIITEGYEETYSVSEEPRSALTFYFLRGGQVEGGKYTLRKCGNAQQRPECGAEKIPLLLEPESGAPPAGGEHLQFFKFSLYINETEQATAPHTSLFFIDII